MPTGIYGNLKNRLLALLPAAELERLSPFLEPTPLEFKQVLCEPGAPITHVYFPHSGVVSWLTPMQSGGSVEVATIGSEGMIGFRCLLGADTSPVKVLVQVPGQALRIEAQRLKAETQLDSPLTRILHRYLNVFLTQVTQSVACNTFHSVEKRFCRWLLMTHDRVHADQFPLTQELLAQMLGVRRASVSDAARKLQKAGLIHYTHGKITILDRAGLESASCECYRVVQEDAERLLSTED